MIVIYGEVLVDLNKKSGCNSFDYFVGGAPFNVAYVINKMNGNVKFIGNVGNDFFGKYIIDFINKNEMNSSIINTYDEYNTTLAFVVNDEKGERDFSFYRSNTADYHFKEDDLKYIAESNIVHIGSLMLSNNVGYNFAKKVISECKKNNKLLSFDVNFRSDIFKDLKSAVSIYKEIINECDIVKISKDELFLFTNNKDLDEALAILFTEKQKVFITLGSKGSMVYFNGKKIFKETIEVNAIDTTGAGDAFYGTILSFIDRKGGYEFFNGDVSRYLYLANIVASYSTLKKGALEGIIDYNTLMSVKDYE